MNNFISPWQQQPAIPVVVQYDTIVHEYAKNGNLNALDEHIINNPGDINTKGGLNVSILVYIININLI